VPSKLSVNLLDPRSPAIERTPIMKHTAPVQNDDVNTAEPVETVQELKSDSDPIFESPKNEEIVVETTTEPTFEMPKQLTFSPKSPRARTNKSRRVKSQQIETVIDKGL
jgi:hypothetical protein